MKFLTLLFLLLFTFPLTWAQVVPDRFEFAGIDIRITQSLRRDIQMEVDKLVQYPKYFNVKVERAKLYFPIIERIFREENVPLDFKYLVVQESALIPDAVSTSNAVGFWQFKRESAIEVGLRIDGHLDERMNIVSSTRGAARYLNHSNFYLDNWVYSLLSYMTGRGGVKKYVEQKYVGSGSMVLDKHTHWYIKKFFAHKLAVEYRLNEVPDPDFYLHEYRAGANKYLQDIAAEFAVNENDLFEYNKWLKRGKIPYDKPYTVIIPIQGDRLSPVVSVKNESKKDRVIAREMEMQDQFPLIEEKFEDIALVEINGKRGVIASDSDNFKTIARLGGIEVDRLIEYNDLKPNDPVEAEQVYYFQSKRNKAKVHYHVVRPGETFWSISQKYGIKLDKLKQKNRIRKGEKVELKPGRVLWMRFIRPRRIPVEYREIDKKAEEEIPVLTNERDNPPSMDNSKNIGEIIAEDDEASGPEKMPENDHTETAPEEKVELVEDASPKDNSQGVDFEEDKPERKEQENSRTIQEEHDENHAIAVVNERQQNVNWNYHIVEKGETLYGLASEYEVTINDLLAWNNMTMDDGLKVGQKLLVKGQNQPEAVIKQPVTEQSDRKTYIYHVVEKGETLYKIARQYEVTIKQIMEWNNKEDFNVRIGESIKILK